MEDYKFLNAAFLYGQRHLDEEKFMAIAEQWAKSQHDGQADVTCRAFQLWLQKLKKEQKHYKLFNGVDINEADLFVLWSEGATPVDALNILSTAC